MKKKFTFNYNANYEGHLFEKNLFLFHWPTTHPFPVLLC